MSLAGLIAIGDPWPVQASQVLQAVVTAVVVGVGGYYAFRKFLHRQWRVPKAYLTVTGEIDSRDPPVAVFEVEVENIGETRFDIVPEFPISDPGEPDATQDSGIQLFSLSSGNVESIRNHGYRLVFDMSDWRYFEPLYGQWRSLRVPGLPLMTPGEKWRMAFAVPLPIGTRFAYVSLEIGVAKRTIVTKVRKIVGHPAPAEGKGAGKVLTLRSSGEPPPGESDATVDRDESIERGRPYATSDQGNDYEEVSPGE